MPAARRPLMPRLPVGTGGGGQSLAQSPMATGTLGAGAGGANPLASLPPDALGAGAGGAPLAGGAERPVDAPLNAGPLSAGGPPMLAPQTPGGPWQVIDGGGSAGASGTLAANLPPRPQTLATPYTPFSGPSAPTVTPRDPGRFTWTAPTSLSEAGQFRLDTGNKAIQRSAAAKGTLLNPGTAMALARYSQGLASEETEKDYERALGAFNANTGATLGFNPQDAAAKFGTYDRAYDASRDIYNDQRDATREATAVQNQNALADFAQQVMAAREAAGTLGAPSTVQLAGPTVGGRGFGGVNRRARGR